MSMHASRRADTGWHLDLIARQWLTLLLLLAVALPLARAAEPVQTATEQAVLEVFVRDACPHCRAAKVYLPAFAATRPWLHIAYRSIDEDPAARADLIRHSRNAGIWPPGVPTFVFKGRAMVGFESAERTSQELVALLEQQPAREETKGVQTPFGPLSVSNLGLPLFTLALGVLDGFNPCAMWILLFLLSMLVHVRDRTRMALVGGTFVLVSGAVYYAFMAAWLNVFLMAGMAAVLRVALGLVAMLVGAVNMRDFSPPGQEFAMPTSSSATSGIYERMRTVIQAEMLPASLATVAVLAVMLKIIELSCTTGFPAMYTAILAQQNLPLHLHHAYLGLYILGVIADDVVLVTIAVLVLSNERLSGGAASWLKLASGMTTVALGLVMLLRPELLR